MTRHGAAAILLAAWVLVEVPPGGLDAQAPAIGTVKRVQTFATHEDCENYRVDMMEDDALADVDTGLDQDDQMRCVSEDSLPPAKPTPPPTPSAAPTPPAPSNPAD